MLTGAIPRTPARLPEDVTALANDSNKDRDPINKNPVTKTYHTLKDLISGKFKRDPSLEAISTDELNNSAHYQHHTPQQQQHQQQQHINQEISEQHTINAISDEDYRSPYSALPMHMRQNHALQSQPNIWNGKPPGSGPSGAPNGSPRSYGPPELPRTVQQRAISQPQLNMAPFDRRDSQSHGAQMDRRGSLANIDVTDSDEGGFAVRRVPQNMHQMQPASSQSMPQRNSPQNFQNMNPYNSHPHQNHTSSPYQTQFHNSNNGQFNSSFAHQLQQQTLQQQTLNADITSYSSPQPLNGSYSTAANHTLLMAETHVSDASIQNQPRQDILRSSFQKTNMHISNQPNSYQMQSSNATPNMMAQRSDIIRMPPQQPQLHSNHTQDHIPTKTIPGSAGSSDYDKSGNHSSNVDSGRGSAAYSSGRKATLDADTSEVAKRLSMANNTNTTNGNDESEWVDIVDAELRNILVPGMQGLMNRPSSTVSGSVSSISPPLPPLSPGGSSYKPVKSKQPDKSKQEYGTDSYNRPGRTSGPIGPSRAGWPGASVQKHLAPARGVAKKQDQAMLKRHCKQFILWFINQIIVNLLF